MGLGSPSAWAQRLAADATSFIVANKYGVAHVFYQSGGGVGPDECCAGAVAVDVVNWTATDENWPDPRRPSGRADPCGGGVVVNINLRYLTCVTTLDASGKMPDDLTRKTQQIGLMDLGYGLWADLLSKETGVWQRTNGTMRVGTLTRLPDNGGCAGFGIGIQTKILQACN